MNQTTTNSFEKITFRAIAVLSIFSLVFGGLISYLQYQEARFYSEQYQQYLKENDKTRTPEFDKCFREALKNDNGSQIQDCYNSFYTPDRNELDRLIMERDSANHWTSIGLGMLIIPLPLFLLYFILRWVFTGRWKRAIE